MLLRGRPQIPAKLETVTDSQRLAVGGRHIPGENRVRLRNERTVQFYEKGDSENKTGLEKEKREQGAVWDTG